MVSKRKAALLLIFGMIAIGVMGSRGANAATMADDFNDGNDNGWQHIVGTEFHVESGEYSLGSPNDGIITLSIVDGWNFVDGVMTVDATIQSFDTDLFLIFEYIDSDNWTGWGFQNNALNYNHLVAGVQQVQTIAAASEAGTHSYGIDVQGGTIDLYYDSSLLFSDSFSGNLGSIGLLTIDGHAHFDNFSATGTTVPEPSSIVLVGVGMVGMALFRKKSTNA
jgi:hypothetical protein